MRHRTDPHTNNTKKKIRKTLLSKWKDPVYKNKMSKAFSKLAKKRGYY